MIDSAAETGTTLMVFEPVRYLETEETCKHLIVDGAVGQVRTVTVHSEHYSPLEGWRIEEDPRAGGGLIDGGIHFIDIFLNIGGSSESVYDIEPPKSLQESDGEDCMVISALFPGDAPGVLTLSAATVASKLVKTVIVSGSDGRITLDSTSPSLTVDSNNIVRNIEVGNCGNETRRMCKSSWPVHATTASQ